MKPIDLATETRAAPWYVRGANLFAKAALPVIIVAGALYMYQQMVAARPEVPQRPARERVWSVETQKVSFDRVQPELRLYGETQSGREVALRALVSGEIIEVAPDLRVGAYVKKGEALVRIDPFNYEGQLVEARANLQEAEARLREIEASTVSERDALANAQDQYELGARDLERAKDLTAKGSLSQRTMDDRRLVVSQREQAVKQRENNLAMNEAKADQQRAAITRLERKVTDAERALENTTLKAPFSGYVTEVNAQVGRVVGTNDVAVGLIDGADVEVYFTLSDRQYGRIVEAGDDLVGRPITVNWYVGETPLTYTGHIARLAPQIAAATGGVRIIAVLDPKEDAALIRPGAFVEVMMPDRPYDGVVSLPETALYPDDEVFVVDGENRLEPRTVEVVGYDGDTILARGDLKPGDPVITDVRTAR